MTTPETKELPPSTELEHSDLPELSELQNTGTAGLKVNPRRKATKKKTGKKGRKKTAKQRPPDPPTARVAAASQAVPKKPSRTRIPGSDFVPNLDEKIVAKSREYKYWVGLMPDCPVDGVTIAGISFPKAGAEKTKDGMAGGHSRLVPVIGTITIFDRAKVSLIREKMARTVLRITKKETQDPDNDDRTIPRKGHLVKIPTEKEIAVREKSGKPLNRYVQRPSDEPIARYIYAELCPDQVNPYRGGAYPPTLEEGGLEFPEELE